jgi:hypothetical protein
MTHLLRLQYAVGLNKQIAAIQADTTLHDTHPCYSIHIDSMPKLTSDCVLGYTKVIITQVRVPLPRY